MTETWPCESGGVTPECVRFRFCGNQVAGVKARTKYVYYVAQGIVVNGCDDLGEPRIAVDRVVEGPFSYRLPEANHLKIDAEKLRSIRCRGEAVRQRYLVDKRDSAIAAAFEWGGESGKIYMEQGLDSLSRWLKSNLHETGTFASQYIFRSCFDLQHFVTEVNVRMKGGRTKRFVHIASYMTCIP